MLLIMGQLCTYGIHVMLCSKDEWKQNFDIILVKVTISAFICKYPERKTMDHASVLLFDDWLKVMTTSKQP